MSLRSQVKKEGEYPDTLGAPLREFLKIDNHTIVLSRYETQHSINIYLGGTKHWCIHCELTKENGEIKEEGYLVKIRYDLLCSIEENIKRGGDITKLIKLLVQYIHDTYPTVQHLLFNDLSTRRCDNNMHTNLAVMSYLYKEKTWYEKHFDVTIAPQSKDALDSYIAKLNKSKHIPWDIMKNTINNLRELSYSPAELEAMYKKATTWKEFFEPIEKKIGIQNFCIFISCWLDSFISKYFNNLMGLTYQMPIKMTDMTYTKNVYRGGERYKSFFKGARKNRTIKRFCEME